MGEVIGFSRQGSPHLLPRFLNRLHRIPGTVQAGNSQQQRLAGVIMLFAWVHVLRDLIRVTPRFRMKVHRNVYLIFRYFLDHGTGVLRALSINGPWAVRADPTELNCPIRRSVHHVLRPTDPPNMYATTLFLPRVSPWGFRGYDVTL